MGNLITGPTKPSAIKGGYKSTTPKIVEQAAAASLNKAALTRRKAILFFIVIAIIGIFLYLSFKGQYGQLFDDLEVLYGSAGKTLALKLILVKTYPFLRPMFFNNQATADSVINYYYMAINGIDPSILQSTDVPTKDAGYNIGLSCIFLYQGPHGGRVDNPLGQGAQNTVFGFLELNPTAGIDNIYQACKGKTSLIGDSTGWYINSGTPPYGTTCCPGSPGQIAGSVIQTIFQYVVPVAGLIIMAL